jgi:hypothetical protein
MFPLPYTSDRSPDGITWSGYGFELTMRVSPLDPTPPTWPVELLSELGKYVYQSGSGFEAGDRMNPRGEITGGRPKTRLTALAFARDPALDPLDTPLGRVEFIQVVGITADELDRMKASSTETVLEELRQGNPSLTTNPSR